MNLKKFKRLSGNSLLELTVYLETGQWSYYTGYTETRVWTHKVIPPTLNRIHLDVPIDKPDIEYADL